ncbi:MAG TPA: sigma-70 family RNA polymerase sigma factor [Bacteroidales bacterium]|nr:sigma-70 family RNA polymerase sigma factor [Bacteroidales bacterium]HPS74426.1 sigma-70 family RNA polymerase sigma factor [Bacteroidales bacterium]
MTKMKYQDDNSYIDRILNGEVAAYASLVEKHKEMVFSIALKILKNREDAEEVAQDTFVKAYQSLRTFEKKARFSTWLYRIVYNASVSRTRKKKLEFLAMNENILQNYTEEEITGCVDKMDENDQRILIDKALKKLPEEDNLLITLFYYSDHSVDEISYITGLSASNVKVRLHRIRKRLYEMISEMMKEEVW